MFCNQPKPPLPKLRGTEDGRTDRRNSVLVLSFNSLIYDTKTTTMYNISTLHLILEYTLFTIVDKRH